MSALDPGVFDGVIRRTKENAQAADTARARSEYTTTEAQIVVEQPAVGAPVRYGASPEEWQHFIDLGLAAELLPIVCNPKAAISPESNLKALGKVPSRYNGARQVVGFHKWTGHRAKPAEVARWSKERDYGIGIQGRAVRALDVDIDDPALAQQVRDFIARRFALPMRVRGGARFLFAFRLDGEFPKRSVVCRDGKVEFLGNGQQWVAAGMHKSGARYEWAGGLPREFPLLTAEEFEALWSDLVAQFGVAPATEARAATERPRGERIDMADPIADFLHERGLVLDEKTDGTLIVTCPWEHEHTMGTPGDDSTVYFPAGVNGQAEPGFRCLHGHCDARHLPQFLDAIGYEPDYSGEWTNYVAQAEAKAAEILRAVADDRPDSDGILAEARALERDLPGDKYDAFMRKLGLRSAYAVLTPTEFVNGPPVEWFVQGVLPKADLVVVYGASGSGKSFVVLDMVLAVARGVQWRGFRTRQSRVIYVAAEGAGGFRRRIAAYAEHNGIGVARVPLGIIPAAPPLRDDIHAAQVAREIKAAGGADLVVVDTLAQVLNGDENGADMQDLVRKLRKHLGTPLGATVLVIHHSGKDVTKGARGSSALRAAADAEFEVVREGEQRRSLECTKMKDADEGGVYPFTLSKVVLGVDAAGEEISSCVVVHGEGGGRHTPRKATTPLGKNELVVLETARRLMEIDPAGVFHDTLVAEAAAQMERSSGGVDRRKQYARQAKESLEQKGRLVIEGPRVRVAD